MKTDEELMEEYKKGGEAAFNEIYLRYKKRVYGYLMKRVKAEQSDDLFQQVFSRLHEKRYLFKEGDPFAPWFFTLIKNYHLF